jgi:pimeloyl-ACP methyl ester carboxylesterase
MNDRIPSQLQLQMALAQGMLQHEAVRRSSLILRARTVRPSEAWLAATGVEFSAGVGTSGCAQLTHYTASYREWGSGPPIVLVPGLAGGCDLFGPLARCLASRFRVITYQMRGEDDCFALRRPFGLDDLVKDLAEFLDWHCLESPIVLGVSFGGVVALDFASRFPHRLQHLVVQGAGARFEDGLWQRVAGTVLSRFPLPTDSPFINQFFNLLFGGQPEQEDVVRFVTSQCWKTDQSIMAHRFRLVEQFDLERRLNRIRVPALILRGDRDFLVSERSLKMLMAGLKQAKLVRLPACGHLAFVTQPERVTSEVLQFIQA